MKSIIVTLLLTFGIIGCSTVKKVVYRIDVPQGNYLEQDKVAQLAKGMNKAQVQYLLGTPMLKDTFDQNRWDYVFIERIGYNDPIQHTVLVYFDDKGVVRDFTITNPEQK